MAENQQNELTSSALFSSRIREMTNQYREQITDLENQVRDLIAENFSYLNHPEKGRIGKIVEKHLANMNAEIIGVKEELRTFELSNLELPRDCTMLAMLRPISVPHDGGWLRFMYPSLARTEYELALFKRDKTTKTPKLIYLRQLHQIINGFGFGDDINAKLDIQFTDTGSGAIPNRGVQPRARDVYNGGAIPAAGFYRMSSVSEAIAGGCVYRAYDSDRENLATSGSWRSYEGDALRMWRVDAQGRKTNETNSDVRIQGWNHTAKARIGDFLATPRVYHYNHSGGHHLLAVDEIIGAIMSCHVGVPPGHATLPINMSNEVNWSRHCNIFTYYWTWRDEVPTLQDAENIKSLLKFWWCAYYRALYNRAPNWRLDKTFNYDLTFPKGCFHAENCWKDPFFDWNTGNEYTANFHVFLEAERNWHRDERNGNGGNSALRTEHWPKFPGDLYGNDTANQNADREWYRQAKLRGEPVIHIMEFFRFYGTSLHSWVKLGRFCRDQKRYHQALEIANRVDATEAEKKNAITLRNWFYTKWEEFRNKEGTDEVERLSNKIIQLIDSVDE